MLKKMLKLLCLVLHIYNDTLPQPIEIIFIQKKLYNDICLPTSSMLDDNKCISIIYKYLQSNKSWNHWMKNGNIKNDSGFIQDTDLYRMKPTPPKKDWMMGAPSARIKTKKGDIFMLGYFSENINSGGPIGAGIDRDFTILGIHQISNISTAHTI